MSKKSKHVSAQKLEPLRLPRMFKRLAWDLHVPDCESDVAALKEQRFIPFLDSTESRTSQLQTSYIAQKRLSQYACLLKKYPFPGEDDARVEAALKKFRASEARCRRINQRFRARRRVSRVAPYEEYLHRARRWISRVIGEQPDFSKIWSMCDFGPGASVGISGQTTHKARKLDCGEWTVTPTCLPYAAAAMIGDPHVWELLDAGLPYATVGIFSDRQEVIERFNNALKRKATYVCANNIVTVPKNARTERTIAIEPLLNGFVQKGIDMYLRERLLRIGIDLTDQTRNQRLALIGSLVEALNPYVTIDLSAASDSLTIELVRELLPAAWFDFLMNTRSPCYNMGGEDVRYQKIASMGNGFCFPLETLIFASLVHSAYVTTGEKPWDFSVYGDDIIVRQSSALLLKELLQYAGFQVNSEKSFWFGPFRESCGADFFDGNDVRPYYLDETLDTIESRIKALNGLSRKGLAGGSLWEYIYKSIPPHLRYVRPYPGPDTAIEVPMDVFMGSTFAKWNKYLQGWRWKELHIQAVADTKEYSVPAMMYAVLRGARSGSCKGSPTYVPEFAYRRKTRTGVRSYPPKPADFPN